MNKKLHVGNLNYATTEADLQRLFAEVGPVTSVTLITDRSSGQSKGFGFVEMETEAAAQAAIDRLNNQEVQERNITVSEARPPEISLQIEAAGVAVPPVVVIVAAPPVVVIGGAIKPR